MDELGVHEHRPDRRPELLVEEVLERERAATLGLVPRVEGRLRKCALEGLDDARRVVDRTTVEGEHRDRRLPRHSQDLGEVEPGQERPAHVRDPLEVESAAGGAGVGAEVKHGRGPSPVRPRSPGLARAYLYATAALAVGVRGITRVSRNPTCVHQAAKSAPVKSKASPNSINMLSDIMSPKAFSRRASSMRCSIATKAPPAGSAS